MSRRTVLRALVGFALALVVLIGFLRAVGFDRVRGELSGADPLFVVAGAASAMAATVCWSEAQRRMLSTGTAVGDLRFRLAYLAGDFTKQTLPMGHVSGPAIMAYTVSEAADVEYEDALAAITVSDLLSLLASVLLAAVGVGAFLLVGRSAFLIEAALAVGVALVAVALLAYVVFHRRARLTRIVVGGVELCHRGALRFVPRWAPRFDPSRTAARAEAYFLTLDRVSHDRRAVGTAAGFALLGWVLFTLPLYAAGHALGSPVPLALALFVVPIAGLATWFPLPGGLGGVELAVATGLVAVGGVTLPAATAVALVYRLCSYWAVVALDAVAGLAYLRLSGE